MKIPRDEFPKSSQVEVRMGWDRRGGEGCIKCRHLS
jgi:hypothetical protein